MHDLGAAMLPRQVPPASGPSPATASGGSTEGRLLEQARRGNRPALDTLFERHRGWLRRWARGRLPAWVRDGIDTSDVVHDALCRTFVRLESFRSSRAGALRAYLQRAVESRIHDQLRRTRRSSSSIAEADWVVGSSPSEHCRFLDDESWAEYRDGLSRLPTRERRLIVGRVEMGYGYRQLALVEGLPSADAARKATRRALRKLIDRADS